MIKRFLPDQPDGIKLEFDLPYGYKNGTDITIFINGQLIDSLDDTANPYGYFLDDSKKIFTFYIAPLSDDHLYVMYDDASLELSFNNIDWTKKIKVIDFSTDIKQSTWKQEVQQLEWDILLDKLEWDMQPIEIQWEQEIKGINFNYSVYTEYTE